MPSTKSMGIRHSEQNILNHSFDEDFGVLMFEMVGYDGQNLQRQMADNMQIYTVSDETYDYFCFAAPGTAQATATWCVLRLDGNGNLMYADGNANYDNIATDPTLLNYAYA